MPREIKFRAWDKENKEMMDWEEVKHNFTDYYGVHNFMQFTGLKDKNGKEIYVGDILQTSSDDPDTDMWKPEDWGYAVCEENPDELGVIFKGFHPTEEEDSVFNWKYVEIIGNIYENKDLLK